MIHLLGPPPLVLGLVLVIVVQLRTLYEKCLVLPHLKHILEFLLKFSRFSCILLNHLDSSARSTLPNTSKSSSGMDTREDKEYILEDSLALVVELEMRARLWGLVRFSILARTPRSTSDDLSLENSSSTVRVSYFSNSRIASTFSLHTIQSKECRNFTALS
jgi:hypothetical protein